jgi:hypothetical protein
LKIEAVLVVLLDFPTGFWCDLGFSDRRQPQPIDCAAAMLAGLGQAVVLRNMRCDVHLAQRRNVIAGASSLAVPSVHLRSGC